MNYSILVLLVTRSGFCVDQGTPRWWLANAWSAQARTPQSPSAQSHAVRGARWVSWRVRCAFKKMYYFSKICITKGAFPEEHCQKDWIRFYIHPTVFALTMCTYDIISILFVFTKAKNPDLASKSRKKWTVKSKGTREKDAPHRSNRR